MGAADLLDPPPVENDDLVCNVERLLLIVGNHDGREADLLLQLLQLAPELNPDHRVEGAEGLIQ